MNKKPLLIAEVKLKSPFGFKASKSWDELFNLASSFGDMISIHTESGWGGRLKDVKKARALTSKTIVAKGIHSSDRKAKKALQLGADYVLIVGRLPQESLLPFCLIEPTDLAQLREFSAKDPENKLKIVWNSRNLKDGSTKPETFEAAREIHKGWICQASNITKVSDIAKSVDAVLIGQNLEEFLASTGQSLAS